MNIPGYFIEEQVDRVVAALDSQGEEMQRLADAVEDLVFLVAGQSTTGAMALDNFRRERARGRS